MFVKMTFPLPTTSSIVRGSLVLLRHWVNMGPEVLDQGAKVQNRKNCLNRKTKIKHLMKVDADKFNPSCLFERVGSIKCSGHYYY